MIADGISTFQGQCNEVPTRFRRFLHKLSLLRRAASKERTFDHNSMSSSPTVVSMTTLPLVGRAMLLSGQNKV